MNAYKSITWFFVLAFVPAWILFLLPLAFGQPGTTTRQIVTQVAWAGAMWMPGIAALITTRFIERQPLGRLNLRHLGQRSAYLWAWLLPPLFAILTGLLTWLFRFGDLDTSFPQIQKQLAHSGNALPPYLLVALGFLSSLTIAPLINTIFAIGEELGWRGFLLPRLLHLGQWPAILISGIVWGIWHAPARSILY